MSIAQEGINIMTREYEKLNTTGSCYKHIPTNTYYSYRTPIYQEFCTRKGLLKVFNDTYYSATTRKHQATIRDYERHSDVVFHYLPYGNWSLDTAFKNEISMTSHQLEKLQNKTRKLGKRQAEELETLKDRLNTLQKLYAEV